MTVSVESELPGVRRVYVAREDLDELLGLTVEDGEGIDVVWDNLGGQWLFFVESGIEAS